MREGSHAELVGIGMALHDISCEACGQPLVTLGKMTTEPQVTYYWWQCESCDRVWYIRAIPSIVPIPMLEWENHPSTPPAINA